jgi:hypothetical protein
MALRPPPACAACTLFGSFLPPATLIGFTLSLHFSVAPPSG